MAVELLIEDNLKSCKLIVLDCHLIEYITI